MHLQARFLSFIVGIAFFGLFLIGIVTYNSFKETGIRYEMGALGELSDHISNMLKGKTRLEAIQKTVNRYTIPNHGIYIADAKHNIYPSDSNPLSINNEIVIGIIQSISKQDIDAGHQENVGRGNPASENDISIRWDKFPVQGAPYTIILLQEYNNEEAFVEFFDVFGVQMVVVGIVVLWISIWGALILASLFKRLDAQKVKLEEKAHALEVAREKALQASIAKSDFLANMSHEIRTPLTAIMGFSESLLENDQLNGESSSTIKTIIRNGKHLLHLINEILDLSKIEAGKLEIEPMRFSPVKLLTDIEPMVHAQVQRKNIKFEINYDFPIPDSINSDPFRLKQVLINLCSNAVKFTHNGYVAVNVSCNPRAQLMCFEVVDTGIGLKDDELDRIFQDFSQADTSISRRYGGTGLGLPLSKRFAALLGGKVSVKSEYGTGSRFTLTIATGVLDDAEFLHSISQLPKINAGPVMSVPGLSGKVLLVEDNLDNQRLLSLLLGKTGIEVSLASNGEQALQMALNNSFDLVFMDMQMPVMDGLKATALLRQQSYTKPIIALTANAVKEDQEQCFSAGCNDFLAKPVDRGRLYKVMSKYLKVRVGAGSMAGTTVGETVKTDVDIALHNTPIKSLFADDPDLADLVPGFIKGLQKVENNIRDAFDHQDWDVLDDLFHQLKGSGGGIGFPIITEIAGEIGILIKHKDANKVGIKINAFYQICERIYAGSEDFKLINAG